MPHIQSERHQTRNNIARPRLRSNLAYRSDQSWEASSQRFDGQHEFCCSAQGIAPQRHWYRASMARLPAEVCANAALPCNARDRADRQIERFVHRSLFYMDLEVAQPAAAISLSSL